MYQRICARIDLSAIRENVHEMAGNLHPGTKLVGVIKADGYGHGALPIAQMLEAEDCVFGYAVATAKEGVELRSGGVEKPILLLGYAFPEDYPEIVENDLWACIFEEESARLLDQVAGKLGKTAKYHLALDTGMSRIGFFDGGDAEPEDEEGQRRLSESLDAILRISRLPHLALMGLFTHLARADETDKTPAYRQMARYAHFLRLLEERGVKIPYRHISNSAGIIRIPEANYDLARAGITLYGLWPSDEVERHILGFRPAMSLVSHLSYVKEIPAGTSVGYGGTWTAEAPTRLGTVPVGYADGYPRGLSNKGEVLVGGRRVPIRGRVCMDQFMVDLSAVPEAKTGDEVVLLGTQGEETITMEELGALSGRFNYELACCISKRVPRVYSFGNTGQDTP